MTRKMMGFTMIELLVVISIIGILASIVLVSFTSSQKQARDTQRKSDLKQYQTALENFANSNDGLYPGRTGTSIRADTTLCVDDLGLSGCPADPKDTSPYIYYYQGGISVGTCNNGNTCAIQYTLRATLESKSDTLWVVCSTGKSGELSSSGNPFSGLRGACPL